jgi:hypothetical protein
VNLVVLLSVDTFVLFQVLRTLEGLAADSARMGLEGCVHCAEVSTEGRYILRMIKG